MDIHAGLDAMCAGNRDELLLADDVTNRQTQSTEVPRC
jgi:hypothetical protein